MPAASKLLLLVPALALLAACESAPYHPGHAVSAAPPPPPNLTGALGAPLAPAVTMPMAGSTVPPGTPMRLSATEISTMLANNTAQGVTTDGQPYAAFFSADGQERFREGNFADAGSWRVLPDGRFCSLLPRLSGNAEECYIMYRSGNAITFQRPDGLTVGSVNVVPGNPLGI